MLGGDGMDSCTHVPTIRRAWGMWPRLVMLDIKCYLFPRPRRLVISILYRKLMGGLTGCPAPSRVVEGGGPDIQVVKSYLPTSTLIEESR
jgi:hypothetical protein